MKEKLKRGKFDFIIKILEKELHAQIGKAVVEAQEYGIIKLAPKNINIRSLKKAIQILQDNNKQSW